MKLYCVRHGESILNLGMRIHQTSDTPLSSAGVKQAELVAKRLRDIDVDAIIASDYNRAKHTASIIHSSIGKPLEFNPLLRELKKPSEIEGKAYDDESIRHIKAEIEKNVNDPEWKFSDEESFREFVGRGITFLEQVGNRDEANLVVVSHGQFLNMVAALITIGEERLTPELYYHFFAHTWMTNTGITVFEQWEPGRWYLLTWNDHAHLA